jgi:hypothetical protein
LLGLDDDDGTASSQGFVECAGDLCGKTFLELRPVGETIDQVYDLREPDDDLLGHVRDVRLAHKRKQVMLASGRSRSKTVSWLSAAKVTSRLLAGSSWRPEKRWA